MIKQQLKYFILLLIQLIEWYEYRNMNLDEDNVSKKIINSINLDNYEILTDTGFSELSELHITQPYTIYQIKTENGKYLECADNHIVFDENMNEIFTKNLNIGSYIQTDEGISKVITKNKNDFKIGMCDLTVNDINHRFYSNGILSHNTVTSAIFIVWYLVFNFDKNALLVADIADTTKEVIDKVKEILNYLPFYMKPGLKVNNIQSMKFDNGSRIIGRSTTKKTGIGFTINLLYMDEFAHINDSYLRFFYRSVYPTVTSFKDSKVIITSTPNGLNMFNELWIAAIEGRGSYHPMRVDYWQIPGRDEEWKQKTIIDLGGSIEDFKQEYGLQFYASDDLILDSTDLYKMDQLKTKYVQRSTDILFIEDKDYSKYLEFHPDFLKKHFTPDMSDLRLDPSQYVFSIDTADGLGRDYSVLTIFKIAPLPLYYLFKNRFSVNKEHDIFSLVQIGKFRTNTIVINEFANICNAIVYRLFNSENVKIILEVNHKGETVHDRLKQNGNYYPGMLIYTKHTDNAKAFEPGIKIGSNKKKKEYCDRLKFNLSVDRMVITEYNTFHELGGLGRTKDGNGIRSQAGRDDLAMTAVNASTYFESPQYWETCEELYDNLTDKEYKRTIEKEIIEFNKELQNRDSSMKRTIIQELTQMG